MAMKACRECGTQVSTDAKVCIKCGKPNPTSAPSGKRAVLLAALAFVVVLAMIDGGGGGGGGEPSTPAAARPEHDAFTAYIMCQSFVEKDLRSPSTADWPTTRAEGVSIQPGDSARYTVFAYVDAQNAFGATIRNRVMCNLRYTGNGNWRLEAPATITP
ncbi:MAG: zinc ribbon domain-containing protein [Gemmatimonadota bacterium]